LNYIAPLPLLTKVGSARAIAAYLHKL